MKELIQKRWVWRLMTFFAVVIAIVAVAPYATFNKDNFAPVFDGRFELGGEIWLYIHPFTGGLALLVGPFQFWKWSRNKHRNIHRWLGRIYLFLGIFPASITGFIVAQNTVAGLTGQIGFSLLAILWFFTGAMALRTILQGDTQSHRVWMIRNFSLTFAAVTLRLWIPILIMAQLPSGIDPELAFSNAYQAVPWLAWVPNLIVGEAIIQVLMPNYLRKLQTLAATD